MRRQMRRSFYHGDSLLHGLLHLLEGTHAYLAHALARDTELGRQVFERAWVLREPTRLKDAPLPVVERGERRGEGLLAVVGFLALGEPGFLVGILVHYPVLPLAGIRLAHLRLERDVAAAPPVHLDDVLLGDAEALRNQLD